MTVISPPLVGSALLGLGIFGLVRYVRVRNRRRTTAMIPERPPTAMAQQGYIQHRLSKSMVSTPVTGSRQYKSHGGKSRSGSLSSNQTPSPSPLRNAHYTRPYSREYEGDHLEYQQPMRNAAYAPIPSARPGDVFAGHYNAYPSTSQPYSSREEMEYLRDLSRSGSMMDIGSTKV